MSYCYHPLKGFYIGDNASGKRKFKVTDWNVDHLEKINDVWTKVYDSFVASDGKLRNPSVHKFISLPCGQCIGCRLQKSREWANRLMLELKCHEKAIFLTLTYNDDNLRWYEGVNPLTGEIIKTSGLCKEDLRKFIQDLRNHNRNIRIRYFACGEYGDQSNRPHYHLIIFGYEPKDLKFYKATSGYDYFTSEEIAKIWPYGYNVIAPVTWESCAYTARYVVKKLNGEAAKEFESLGIIQPFVCMSTKPGIAHDYYMENRSEFTDDRSRFYISTNYGSVSFSKPRYFKKLDDIEGNFIPADFDSLIRKADDHHSDFADMAADMEMERTLISLQTDMEYIETLASGEINKLSQIRSLKRKEI